MHLYDPSAFDFSTTVPSYWEATAEPLGRELPALEGAVQADVAIIGGGYAGLHAGLRLAKAHGLNVCVLEAGDIGWGASGRNAGFCCPGSAKLTYSQLMSRFGRDETARFYRAQREAIEFVGGFLEDNSIDAGRTGGGELQVAHTPGIAEELKQEQSFMREAFGEESTYFSADDLEEQGFASEAFHGGLMVPQSFGLHPLNYVRGLAKAAIETGVLVYPRSEVVAWEQASGRHVLKTGQGEVSARHVVVATNGYTDETLPVELGGRLLPALTRIIVTRPISDNELKAQGWLRTDPTYDTRNLLHYFRLLPDNRFLFGGRGGLDASDAGMESAVRSLRASFDIMFPRLSHMETEYFWGGFVCLTSTRLPFAGPIEGMDNVWGAFGWHGNGVSMASYAANRLADVIAGQVSHDEALPQIMQQMPGRFVLPSLRVQYLKAAYLGYGLKDMFTK